MLNYVWILLFIVFEFYTNIPICYPVKLTDLYKLDGDFGDFIERTGELK
jgi:hypothetical protein